MNNMFQNRLKELRKEKKLSQSKLGKALNIHIRTIAYYESGERTPSPETFSLLADFFEVSIDYLMGRTTIRNYNMFNDIISFEKLPPDAQKEILNFFEYIKHKYLS